MVETENYYFIAPDNGLLSFIFNEDKTFRVFELTNERYFKHPMSNTFHGRDIFAPAAAYLSNGIKPDEFGNELKDFAIIAENKPRKISDTEIEAEIIHIDRFGNLISNLRKEDLPEDFTVLINGKKISKLQQFFAESKQKRTIYDIWKRGIFGNSGISRFGGKVIKCQNVPQKLFLEINQ